MHFFSTNDVKQEVFGKGVIICNDEFERKFLIREKRSEQSKELRLFAI